MTVCETKQLKVYFPVRGGVFGGVKGYVKAVDDVSLAVEEGEIVSVVGESGCGKTTLGLSILGLVPVTDGELYLNEQKIDTRNLRSWSAYRKDMQIVFQDPFTSLNPRHTAFRILAEPLLIHRICRRSEVRDRAAGLMEQVGLSPEYLERFPHAFSGGQRQRIAIARAVGIRPRMIICDEVASALDVSVQAQIIQLLMDLKKEMGLSLLFIAHDLSLVKAISDRVNVMYLGKIVESAPASRLFRHPQHPYTEALLKAIPTMERARKPKILPGEPPSPVNVPSGCVFRTRCPYAQEKCKTRHPETTQHDGRSVACYFPLS